MQYYNQQPPTGLPSTCSPSAPSGSDSIAVPDAVAWPTSDGVTTVDNQCEFITPQDPTGNDMSSLVFSSDGSVLWGAQNKNHVWKLVKDPTTGKFLPATDNDWGNGKGITFTGTDPNASQPDDEGLTVGGNGDLFVTSERDNQNSKVSKDEVLEYDPNATGTTLAPVQQWDLTSEFVPSVIAATGDDSNLGFEGVTYVPDSFLTAHNFHDQNLNKTYNPADYPLHGSGLYFLGLEKNGHVYAYALNSDGTFQRVADIDTGIDGTSAIADLQFNADDQGIWTDCDNDCGVVDSLLRIDAHGNFVRVVSYNRPAGLPDDNLEGFAIAPASTAVNGEREVVWSDDGIYGEGNAWNAAHTGNVASPDWGHALYSSTLPVEAVPTVSVSPDTNPAVTGQTVNLTATVSGPSGVTTTPSGTVEFASDGTVLPGCSAVVLTDGQATCSANQGDGFVPGAHNIVVTYSGDDSFDPSDNSGSPLVEQVNQASTSTALSADNNPVVTGQQVIFTANVTVNAPGSTAAVQPGGTVDFQADGTDLANCSDVPIDETGTATCTSEGFTPSAPTITATYSGDGSFLGSSAPSITETVNQDATVTNVTASANPPVNGQSVTYSATVVPVGPGSGTPTGTVTFSVTGPKKPALTCTGGNTVTVSGGSATCMISASKLTAGATYSVAVAYSGDSGFSASNGSGQQTIAQGATGVTLTSNANPSVSGAAVTIQASVAAISPANGTPTGTVTFGITGADNSVATCKNADTVKLSGGNARCVLAAGSLVASSGPYTVTASYSGSTAFTPSSGSLSQNLTKAQTALKLQQSSGRSPAGQPVTFTATVKPTPASRVPLGGSVTFTVTGAGGDSVECDGSGGGSTTGSGGGDYVASCTVAAGVLQMSDGPYQVAAFYSGDANDTASSASLSHVVTKAH